MKHRMLIVLAVCAMTAGCGSSGGGGGAEQESVKVPDTLTAEHTDETGKLWAALSSEQKDKMATLCKAQAATEQSTGEGLTPSADPQYQKVQALDSDELVERLNAYYSSSPNESTTIRSACNDETKSMLGDAPLQADNEATGTGTVQTNVSWSEVWNGGAVLEEGDEVVLAARVYQDVGDSLLVYGDPQNDEFPTQVFGSFRGIREDDYVLVRGVITGADSYETVTGGQVDVVTVAGDRVQRIGRDRAFSLANPAVGGKRKLNLTQTQAGFQVTLRSIEWTDDATRVNVKVTNNGADKASLSTYDSVLQQGSRQYDLSDDDEGGFELSDDIRPGVTKTATLTFEKVSRKRGKGYLEFEWFSDNYDIDSDTPFAFTMSWKP